MNKAGKSTEKKPKAKKPKVKKPNDKKLKEKTPKDKKLKDQKPKDKIPQIGSLYKAFFDYKYLPVSFKLLELFLATTILTFTQIGGYVNLEDNVYYDEFDPETNMIGTIPIGDTDAKQNLGNVVVIGYFAVLLVLCFSVLNGEKSPRLMFIASLLGFAGYLAISIIQFLTYPADKRLMQQKYHDIVGVSVKMTDPPVPFVLGSLSTVLAGAFLLDSGWYALLFFRGHELGIK